MPETKIIIIYDTYCGWCYGAAPLFDALVATGAKVQALHRQLFQGPLAYRMSEGKGAAILIADARIEELTGQPFSDRYRANVVVSATEVLDSRYSAQAAALVHEQGVEKEFALRKRLEVARFVGGMSASDRDGVIAALIAEGVVREEAEKIGRPELAAKAADISRRAQDLMASVGARGVPTLLKVTGNHVTQIDHTAYYGRPDEFTAELASPELA